MHFVRYPSADLKHIWSHGKVPNPFVDKLPDCGAKQLLFSRLYAYCTTLVGAMDADTACSVHALLRQLAVCYRRGGPEGYVRFSTPFVVHLFDVIDAGLAYFEPGSTTDGIYILTEPLVVELCEYLSHELVLAPAAVEAWELRLQSSLQGAGATVSEAALQDSVAVWKFRDFVSTPKALVGQKKRGVMGSPMEHYQAQRKKSRTLG